MYALCSDCRILIDAPKFHLSVYCMFLCVVTIKFLVSTLQASSLKSIFDYLVLELTCALTINIDLRINYQLVH